MPVDIERALADAEYRKTLTPEELALVAKHRGELTEDELRGISGGTIQAPRDVHTGQASGLPTSHKQK